MTAKRIVRNFVAAALMVLAATIGATATQDAPFGEQGRDRPDLTGSWQETVTLVGGAPFSALLTFGEAGTLLASYQGSVITGPFPFPASYSPGHGQWTRRRAGTFSTTVVQMVSDLTDGHLLFINKVRQTVTIGRSGNTYRSVTRAEFYDPAGNLVFAFDGTTQGRRIGVEPLE